MDADGKSDKTDDMKLTIEKPEKKSVVIGVRLSPAQAQELTARAKKAGLRMSSYINEILRQILEKKMLD